ncbi:uncharacterized protein LOC120339505 isoform X1 [Styela clava]
MVTIVVTVLCLLITLNSVRSGPPYVGNVMNIFEMPGQGSAPYEDPGAERGRALDENPDLLELPSFEDKSEKMSYYGLPYFEVKPEDVFEIADRRRGFNEPREWNESPIQKG